MFMHFPFPSIIKLIIDELDNMKMINKIGSVFEVGGYDTAVGLIEI